MRILIQKNEPMKKIFYVALTALVLFEVLKIYLIMPMPGSQEISGIDLAYFMEVWKWPIRLILGIPIIMGALAAYRSKPLIMLFSLGVALVIVYFFNYEMKADEMFLQPSRVTMANAANNTVAMDKLVVGIHHKGESKAYPIQLIAYHHQVMDTVKGEPVMVTYCSVCRTGRVFEPLVQGNPDSFKLVGMNRYNAMFEDGSTKSWWRQATGEAIAGPMTGEFLPEMMSEQMSLKKWLDLYPQSKILQPDPGFGEEYDELEDYDFGIERGDLTRTDTLSWKEKSWVVGIQLGDSTRAVDWNRLKAERLINFTVSGKPLMVALASDNQSFFAFERPGKMEFELINDSLVGGEVRYGLSGNPNTKSIPSLRRVQAYQEFWHSWRTFHPEAKIIE